MEMYHEQQEMPTAKPALVVYPKRKQLMALGLLIIFLLIVLCSGSIIFWLFFWRPVLGFFNGSMIESVGLYFLLITCIIVLLFWQFRKLLQALFTHQSSPVLIVNSIGIQMYAMPGSGDFFITWPEIDSISVHSYRGLRYLGIRPKCPEQYLSRFTVLKRFGMRLYDLTGSGLSGLPPINVGLIYLNMSVTEFFQRLSLYYKSELSENHVRLLP